jgi:2-methylcitrate dehydratase PrpD
LAADGAASGLLADDDAMIDVFAGAYGQAPDPDELTSPFDSWAISDSYHKQYASCQYTHATVECALELARSMATVDLKRITEIRVETHPLALALDQTAPQTTLGAKFSVPHVVAAVLASGRVDSDVFGADGLHDPRVARLREAVVLAPYAPILPAPLDRPSRVTITLDDGATAQADCQSAVGGPDRPLSDDTVLAKVDTLTTGSAPGFSAVARELVDGAIPGSTPWPEVLGRLLAR